MISNMDQKTETFLRKRNETLSAIAASLKSIDRSLQRIAAALEKIAAKEETAAVVDAGVKEDDDGRTSA